MKCIPALIAAAIGALASAPALSSNTASASIGSLSISLFDLNLADGVTPWITFQSDDGGASYGAVSVPTQDGGGSSASPFFGLSLWTPNAISSLSDGGSATAAISGNSTATGTTFAVSASATGFTGPDAGITTVNASAGAGSSPADFSLSANTLVVISGDASVAGALSASTGGMVYTFAGMSMAGLGPLGSGLQRAEDQLQIIGDYSAGATVVGPAPRRLTVSFTNLLNASASGEFRVYTEVRVGAITTPVPEPETYALMLAGLAAIGLMARRRT